METSMYQENNFFNQVKRNSIYRHCIHHTVVDRFGQKTHHVIQLLKICIFLLEHEYFSEKKYRTVRCDKCCY